MREHYAGCSKEYPRGGFRCEVCDRRIWYRTVEQHERGPTHAESLKAAGRPAPYWCRDCEKEVRLRGREAHESTRLHLRNRWRRCPACRRRIRRVNMEAHSRTAAHALRHRAMVNRRRKKRRKEARR